jgi:LysM repeat protein
MSTIGIGGGGGSRQHGTDETQHTVQKGETLDSIAKQYGVSSDDLLKLNPQLQNADKLQPGVALLLPAVLKESATPNAVQGDTVQGAELPNLFTPEHGGDAVRQFYEPVISEVKLPALDAGSKDAGYMDVKLSPETLTLSPGEANDRPMPGNLGYTASVFQELLGRQPELKGNFFLDNASSFGISKSDFEINQDGNAVIRGNEDLQNYFKQFLGREGGKSEQGFFFTGGVFPGQATTDKEAPQNFPGFQEAFPTETIKSSVAPIDKQVPNNLLERAEAFPTETIKSNQAFPTESIRLADNLLRRDQFELDVQGNVVIKNAAFIKLLQQAIQEGNNGAISLAEIKAQ